jgi:[ribosomal protein S5]-alanine N-acetyltransferase
MEIPQRNDARKCTCDTMDSIMEEAMNHTTLFSIIPILQSERLKTSPIAHADDAAFVSIMMNPNCFLHTPGSARKTADAAIHIIDHYARDFIKQKTVMMGLYERSTNRLIGILEVFNIDKKMDSVEIGYRLDESVWRKGYGTEACALLTRYLSEVIGVRTIKATAMVRNVASNRLLLKCGYKIVATTFQQHTWKDKGLVDLNHYEYDTH